MSQSRVQGNCELCSRTSDLPRLPTPPRAQLTVPLRHSLRCLSRVLLSVSAIACLLAFSSQVSLAQRKPIFVSASFSDRNGLHIDNLNRGEVELLENNQLRDIELLARNDIPTAFAFLFDTSLAGGTMEGRRRIPGSATSGAPAAMEIAFDLIDRYRGRNLVMIAGYEREIHIALDFTADGFAAKEAVRQLQGTKRLQESFLYSALFETTRKMSAHRERRRVIIVFLDTLDSRTAAKQANLKNLIAESNVELFIVSVASRNTPSNPGLPPTMSRSALRDLCSVTAGDVYFVADYGDHLEDLRQRLGRHLQTLYTLGFESESPEDDAARLLIRCLRPGSTVRSHPVVPILR